MNNKTLNRAKFTYSTDEWFTPYKIIESEVVHYIPQFYGKTVLCNCGDSLESEFSKYFIKNFYNLRLKKLILIAYKHSKIHELGDSNLSEGVAHKVEIYDVNGELRYNFNLLDSDGDFRTKESVEQLKLCDIVVTNPPFSLFSQLFELVNLYKKEYLLISNQNAIMYKNIFPYIVEDKCRVGYWFGKMEFRVPNGEYPSSNRHRVDENGNHWKSLGNALWLTNLKVENKIDLELSKRYSPGEYPKYDNYNAIHVSKVFDIPIDYEGIMGVPLTYIKYHNKESIFNIVGEANHGRDNEYDLFEPYLNKKPVFKRLLIKRK